MTAFYKHFISGVPKGLMMKTEKQPNLNKQRGAATLFTALIILVGITLVTLTTSKTTLVQTQIAADNYRTAQAVAAANYAMDYGVHYVDNGGFDQVNNDTGAAGSDGVPDIVSVPSLTSTDGRQTTTATLQFIRDAGTRCVAAGATPNMKDGLISATGLSDDGLASRTISQCVANIPVLKNGGPQQPLIAQANVALTGNARIINRYTNTTIWAGDRVAIGSSSSMETRIKDPAVGTLTQAQLLATDTSNTQLVSNRNLGNGLDIIDSDPSLGTLTGLNFFTNFFNVQTRDQLRTMAASIGQSYTNIESAKNRSGLIWVDGNQTMNGGTIGSLTDPAIVVINGNFDIAGNTIIFGVLYVVGKYDIGGTPTVVGSNVVEGTNLATGLPITPMVTGNGTINLVFWQNIEGGNPNGEKGKTSVVGGSWSDWL